jgi:hypothetical protein
MEQKTLSGVESVYNQVRDTAVGRVIHRTNPAMTIDTWYLLFFLGLTLRTTIYCGLILNETNA